MDEQTMGNRQERDLMDYLVTAWRWRRFVLVNMMMIIILATVVVFLLPNWYRASVSIIPPKDQDMLSTLGTAGSMFRSLGTPRVINPFAQKLGAYNYLAILKSRTAMESVVRKFDLIRVYDISDNSMEKAVEALKDNVSFEIQDEDYITIEVLDKDRQRAADIANYFAQVLNEISIRLGTQEASNNREFIEKSLEKSKMDLLVAEEALRTYQEKTGILIAMERTSPTISAIADLYGTKARKEIELSIMRKKTSGDNPMVLQLELELNELNRKLSKFPEIATRSMQLYRDVVIYQKIIEFLTPIYEQAKIDEQKDVPVLLVLDKAVPPEQKAKPRRLVLIVTSMLITFLFSITLVFLMAEVPYKRVTGRPSELYNWSRKIATLYKIDANL
ncbi:MAG: Wzz/FepE/Etk N-terminal domain-containing protein [Candidatus Nitrosotenuis sp.]